MENGEVFDYNKLLVPGQKRVGPSTLPIAGKEMQDPLPGRSEMEKRKPREQKDMAPNFSGNVIRKRHNRAHQVPIVLQTGLDEKAEFTHQFQAADSKGNLKPLTPIEEASRQSTEGYIDPLVAKKAEKQRRAIGAYYAKQK